MQSTFPSLVLITTWLILLYHIYVLDWSLIARCLKRGYANLHISDVVLENGFPKRSVEEIKYKISKNFLYTFLVFYTFQNHEIQQCKNYIMHSISAKKNKVEIYFLDFLKLARKKGNTKSELKNLIIDSNWIDFSSLLWLPS